MPKEAQNIFQMWEFTEEEYPIAVILTDLTYKHIQTELAKKATERAIQPYTPDNPEEFKLTQEFNRGYIEALGYILACSDEAKRDLTVKLQEEAARLARERKES